MRDDAMLALPLLCRRAARCYFIPCCSGGAQESPFFLFDYTYYLHLSRPLQRAADDNQTFVYRLPGRAHILLALSFDWHARLSEVLSARHAMSPSLPPCDAAFRRRLSPAMLT